MYVVCLLVLEEKGGLRCSLDRVFVLADFVGLALEVLVEANEDDELKIIAFSLSPLVCGMRATQNREDSILATMNDTASLNSLTK